MENDGSGLLVIAGRRVSSGRPKMLVFTRLKSLVAL